MSLEHVTLYSDLEEAYRLPIESFEGLATDATIQDIVDLVTKSQPVSSDEVFNFICDTIRHQLDIEGQFGLNSRLMSDVGFDGM